MKYLRYSDKPAKFLFVLLIGLAAVSCSGPAANENSGTDSKDADIRKTYDNSGNLVAQVEYKNDLRDGTAWNYYTNGKPKLKVEYKEGKKHGKYSWYHENGAIYNEVDFKEGLKDGFERFYREDGSVKYETPYKADRPGTGFMEYAISGDPKKYLASLDITIDSRSKANSSGVYSIYLGLTDYTNVKEVYYYLGALDDGQFLHDGLEELYTSGMNAEAHLDKKYGSSVSVTAEILTKDGKTIVLNKSHRLPF